MCTTFDVKILLLNIHFGEIFIKIFKDRYIILILLFIKAKNVH